MTKTNENETQRAQRTIQPRVDILEQDERLVLLVDVPGADKESIQLDVEGRELRVEASTQAPSDELPKLLEEYPSHDYRRRFFLPTDVDGSKIEAKVSDGVLEITLPKLGAETKRVVVKTA